MPNNMALSLIHMHCMAHGNGVVGGWHSCHTRVHCRNTRGKRMLRNCGALRSRWFEQCGSWLSLAYVVLHACEWIFSFAFVSWCGPFPLEPQSEFERSCGLDKFWVPMQLEMAKDSECDNELVVCCGYDAMLLRGPELDDAPRSEWTKANRPGWRMLIMPPQLPREDDISLVAVKKIDCGKTYEEAEARRVQYKTDAKV